MTFFRALCNHLLKQRGYWKPVPPAEFNRRKREASSCGQGWLSAGGMLKGGVVAEVHEGRFKPLPRDRQSDAGAEIRSCYPSRQGSAADGQLGRAEKIGGDAAPSFHSFYVSSVFWLCG